MSESFNRNLNLYENRWKMNPAKSSFLCSSFPFPLSPLLLFIIVLFLTACNTLEDNTPLAPTRAPSSTVTPTRSPTLEPTATVTAPVTWRVDWPVAELSATYLNLNPFKELWLDGNTLLMTQERQRYQIHIVGDHVSVPLLIPTPTPLFANPYSSSPQENYVVECEPARLTLYQLPSHQIIGQFQAVVPDCEMLRWRTDETALSFTNEAGQVFVWEFLSQAPREVGTATADTPAPWSPDGSRILIFVPNDENPTWTLFSIKMDGQKHNMGIEVGGDHHWYPEYVHWVTNDLIENFIGGPRSAVHGVFDADTGEQLIYIPTQYGDYSLLHSQFANKSPDNLWMILDRPAYEYANPVTFYELFDLQRKQIISLGEGTYNFLHFLGWKKDSSLFYLVSRPLTEDTRPDPNLPSGLLALDPTTGQFTQLIPDAMYALLNPQQELVFVLLPANRKLDAIIYTVTGNPLVTFQSATAHIPYLIPGEGLPIPAVWSNDGTRIVFSDMWGRLWLADASGVITELSRNLGFDRVYPRQPYLSWSPDDSHLLIAFDERAWVITIP